MDNIKVKIRDVVYIDLLDEMVEQAVPQIDVDENLLVTATSRQKKGSVAGGVTKSTYQIEFDKVLPTYDGEVGDIAPKERLRGKWVFDKIRPHDPNEPPYDPQYFSVSFLANDLQTDGGGGEQYVTKRWYDGLRIYRCANYIGGYAALHEIGYVDVWSSHQLIVWENGEFPKGIDKSFLTIEISSKYDEVENAEELVRTLNEYATFYPEGAIILENRDGLRFLTERKYCKENLDVIPMTEALTVTENGEYTPETVGFSSVRVNVPSLDYDTVFNEGYSLGWGEGWQQGAMHGREEGIEEGKETGKQEEYDRFWDTYQQNGNRLDYSYAFAGFGWTDKTFKPKYDIKPTHASHLFSNCQVTNFVGKLDASRVSLDTSNLISFLYLAQHSKIESLPDLDMRKARNLDYFLYGNENLHTIDKIILKNDGSQTFTTYTFFGNTALTEIRFEGVIGQPGLNFSASPLSFDSLVSIIEALQDKTGDTSKDWLITIGDTNIATLGSDCERITAKGWRYV